MLVELIGEKGPASDDDMDMDGDTDAAKVVKSAEHRAMGPTECAAMARLLLNLILELFGMPHQRDTRHHMIQPIPSMHCMIVLQPDQQVPCSVYYVQTS